MTTLMLKFTANHPCGAGHFPGNPIIPGALLLDEVLACIAENLAGENLAWGWAQNWAWQVKSAKFPQPVRPGDTVYISYTQTANGEIRFACKVSSNRVMSGIASARPLAVDGLPP